MRISAGSLRGRLIIAPAGLNTRPTSGRVRQALMEHLVHARLDLPLPQCRVLDLFAGSGAFSFEAISRGAPHATLIECDRPALKAIDDNIRALDLLSRTTVVRAALPAAIRLLAPMTPFNLVFSDPPYLSEHALPTLQALVAQAPLASGALIVYEHDRRHPVTAIGNLPLVGTRLFGDTQISFFQLPQP